MIQCWKLKVCRNHSECKLQKHQKDTSTAYQYCLPRTNWGKLELKWNIKHGKTKKYKVYEIKFRGKNKTLRNSERKKVLKTENILLYIDIIIVFFPWDTIVHHTSITKHITMILLILREFRCNVVSDII